MNKPTRAHAGQVWVFDPEKLELGDIVLERGARFDSAVVAAVTRGPYSHALIWVGNDFVEAMPGGVRSLSFARVPVVAVEHWALFRARPQFLAVAAQAADNARGMAFKTYDAEGALRTQIGGRKTAVSTSRFCSQLIAEAYLSAGLELLPGKRPEQVTPNMLARSKSHDRLELPLMDATRVNGGQPYPQELLDRSAAFRSAPMQSEGDIARAIFDSVEDLISTVALPAQCSQPRPGNLSEALDLLPYLPSGESFPIADRLLDAMDHTGYFDLLRPQFASISLQIGQSDRHQIPGWRMSLDRHRKNAGACGERYAVMPHPIWRRLQAMYSMNAAGFESLIAKASEAEG